MQEYQYYAMLDKLLGLPVSSIGRTADMLWIGFGPIIHDRDYKGEQRSRSSFALHIQSAWRIKSEKKIILANGDIYYPAKGVQWTEDFDWEPLGNNRFDVEVKKVFSRLNGVVVASYQCSDNNDLTLFLSNGDVIEVFVDCAAEAESWRFFECGKDLAHLVVLGSGICFE